MSEKCARYTCRSEASRLVYFGRKRVGAVCVDCAILVADGKAVTLATDDSSTPLHAYAVNTLTLKPEDSMPTTPSAKARKHHNNA